MDKRFLYLPLPLLKRLFLKTSSEDTHSTLSTTSASVPNPLPLTTSKAR